MRAHLLLRFLAISSRQPKLIGKHVLLKPFPLGGGVAATVLFLSCRGVGDGIHVVTSVVGEVFLPCGGMGGGMAPNIITFVVGKVFLSCVGTVFLSCDGMGGGMAFSSLGGKSLALAVQSRRWVFLFCTKPKVGILVL